MSLKVMDNLNRKVNILKDKALSYKILVPAFFHYPLVTSLQRL